MLVHKSFKHRAFLESRTLYVILENFSSLHYKLFENIRIFEYFELFEYYSNIFYSTNNICYSIRTIWLRRIIFNIRFGPRYIFVRTLIQSSFKTIMWPMRWKCLIFTCENIPSPPTLIIPSKLWRGDDWITLCACAALSVTITLQ